MIKSTLKAILALSLLVGGVSTLSAGESKAPHNIQNPKLKPLTPEAEKAAYKLFDALKMKEGIRNALLQQLAFQIKRNPGMAPYADIYKNAFIKYTKWDNMKKDLAKLYAQAFSAKEMNELAKFYSTKLGKKTLTVMPRLSQLSIILAQQNIAKHAKEIKDAVAKRAKELEKKAKK